MPEPKPIQDQAALYVLDQLSRSDRRDFEAQLASSAELRALVRDLEAGAAALAAAASRRQPPKTVWMHIEKAVAEEAKNRNFFTLSLTGWVRSGWAAAAACLVGWLLYAVWINRTEIPGSSSETAVAQANLLQNPAVEPMETESAERIRQEAAAQSNAALQKLQASEQEIRALRWQLHELTNYATQLARNRDWQQLLLNEPNRIKFFQLTPPATAASPSLSATVSSNLQRALYAAMARELGWVPTNAAAISEQHLSASQAGVSFLDLRSGNNVPATAQSSPSNTGNPGLSEDSPGGGIPGFISGTNLFLAFDPTVAPPGSTVTLITTDAGQSTSLRSFALGENATVVALSSATASGGVLLTVTASAPNGFGTTLGQVSIPSLPPNEP